MKIEPKALEALLVAHAKGARVLKDTGIDVELNPAGQHFQTLAGGVCTMEVECAQSMFKIDSCTLTVKDGSMTASLVLGAKALTGCLRALLPMPNALRTAPWKARQTAKARPSSLCLRPRWTKPWTLPLTA